jgi:outer membrane immunogenic protein
MRKTSVLAGATLLLAGPAVAADLARPVYKAPAFVPGFTWTGCYAGADVGGAWSHQSGGTTTTDSPNIVPPPAPVPGAVTTAAVVIPSAGQADTAGDFSRGSSVIGGPYVGCNYQFANGVVLGAEGDFSWTGLSGSFDAPNVVVPTKGPPFIGDGGISMTSDTRWTATLRARLGYAIMPSVLVYGTAGGAWGATDYTGSDTFNNPKLGPITTSFSSTDKGWVAGGGVEWAPWSNNWILRAEYLHYEFGGVSTTVAIPKTAIATTFNFGDLKIDTVRAGIAYKF